MNRTLPSHTRSDGATMSMYILLAVVVLVAALLAYAATRPDTMRVQRSTVISAAPAVITPHIDDFHAWSSWSPYEKLDPNMTKSFGGAPRGPGATYEWNGNNKSGAGRMEVLSSDKSRVAIKLDFTRPFRASNVAEFLLVPQNDGTAVTWAMT